MTGLPTEIPVTAAPFSLDRWDDEAGYDPDFLGISVPLPMPAAGDDDVVDVAGLPHLTYTHFSVVLSRSRRLPFVAAVNVDGASLVDLVRTGSWRFDPRIPEDLQIGNDAYVDNDFDRGHMVRRISPVWGAQEVAERANHDTFHYTNCAPQHKALNQRTWVDLESYLLDRAAEKDTRASIFTGPVFRSDDLLYRDEYLIPADFWKIAVAVDDGGLVGAAYLQTQRNLLAVAASPFGDYKTYRVPIALIAQLTGLDLGPVAMIEPPQAMQAARRSITEVRAPEDAGFLD